MKNYILLFGAALMFAAFSACNHRDNTKKGYDELITHIDSTIKPGDDFFLFTNGKWFKEHPIPPSEQSNGLWQLIRDTINAQVLNICESSAKIANVTKGSNKQKIGDFFYSGMDSVSLNKKGLAELKEYLNRIDAVKDLNEFAKEVAFVQRVSASPLFSFNVTQDDRISSKYAIIINQGGLSLPERSYYFDKDPQAVKVRQKFQEYLLNIYKIMGYSDQEAKSAADKTMKLETEIAKNSRKMEDTRDPLKNYTKSAFLKLKQSMPDFNWDLFMEMVGLKNADTVITGQPEFLTALNKSLKSVPLKDWKNYLKFHFVRGLSKYLDDKTYFETFNFYSTTLRGIKEPRPRWKRVVEETDGALGELIGQVYVDEYLPKGTKEKLLEIGNDIKTVYAERIKALDWMSEPTKQKALKKLDAVIMKVGYPDQWKDMSKLQIDRGSFVRNAMNANEWWFNFSTLKYGKPVDRKEWGMFPQTYNAYYNPSNNEICVPGCNIIVPGYERVMADDALLYAIIGGSTFGHEITHGFDDQGCKYDLFGNLNNWWTPEDSKNFISLGKKLEEYFSSIEVTKGFKINGKLTLGENIADLGGLTLGYYALEKSLEGKKKPEPINGFTYQQRFFLGWAQVWRENMTNESLINQVQTNEHSPARWRINATLPLMKEFSDAFGCKCTVADSLKIVIW